MSVSLLTSLYDLLLLQPFYRQKQKPNNSSSPCQLQGSESKEQDWTHFFFLLPKLLLRTSKERKQNWNPLCVWSYSTFTGLSEHFHSSALLPASPSSWWSSKAVILYLTKKSLIFSWISSLKQLTCLHKQHDQHKVRIVWLEARREDVTTAGPRHLPKPIQQKQLITFEVLLSNYKISEKLLAPWTSEN